MIDPSRKEGQPMTRAELLQFEGVSRSVLEDRIALLVEVLDAAAELVRADDAAQEVIRIPAGVEKLRGDALEEAKRVWFQTVADRDERYERAWDQLRSVLKFV